MTTENRQRNKNNKDMTITFAVYNVFVALFYATLKEDWNIIALRGTRKHLQYNCS